ncbi:metallothionein family 14 [Cyanobacterium stanieri PCC 7202]|uniref:Metallothionein family 14 n=1 Tax=Cyanobacterium stanieri (strain ATCC 29140 / PCC 7202) TaxID=292563 RepID=K9YQD6_CYASC|nr:metallothionein family 14 [Cyanobacterium stanieri PCC 7202]
MTTVTQMKCACPSCLCIVNLSDAIQKNDHYYCCQACADGHPNGSGCGHTGCGCDK